MRCVQLLGHSGMGKTTHLRALPGELPSRYTYCEPGLAPPRPPLAGWWLLDETQRWQDAVVADTVCAALTSPALRVGLGTHRSHARALRAAGVVVACFRLGGLRSVDELRLLLEDYLHAAGSDLAFDGPALARLLRRSGGNVELALRLAYEVAEDLPAARAGVADIERAVARLRRDAPQAWEWRQAARNR